MTKAPGASPSNAAPDAEAAPTSGSDDGTSTLDAFLPDAAIAREVDASRPRAPMCSARIVRLKGHTASVLLRGESEPYEAELDEDVDPEIVQEALENGERVMLELDATEEYLVVGVLRSRKPEKLRLTAEVIEIDAERELLLKSGKGAMRIQEDGDVELIGSRISAASRGLFRLVGRMLRLN